MTIKVRIKNVYGKEMIYPACPKAELFTALLGQETLTRTDINLIKQLGYAIEVTQEVTAL